MSRTDKDRPYRVRAADPHQRGRYARHGGFYYWQRSEGGHPVCDLPDFHDRTPEASYFSGRDGHTCTWELEHYVFSPYGSGGVPKWYVRAFWHSPERTREREDLGAARRLYNAGDDLEDFDFANYRSGRSSARWNFY